MSHRTDQIDESVFSRLPEDDYASINELCGFGFRRGTVSSSLRRLVEEGSVIRKWDGNQRYGRFLYKVAPEADHA